MSKNKNKGRTKDAPVAEGESTAPKTRKPLPPRGPLPERLVNKVAKIHAMVTDMVKEMTSRGAPKDNCEVATAFVVQVEGWRENLIALKNSGWEPSVTASKTPIVEGDPIKIIDEHLPRYAFIEGLAEGRVQLVAGAVVQVNKLQIDVMLKDTEGKFYGYVPRRFVARR